MASKKENPIRKTTGKGGNYRKKKILYAKPLVRAVIIARPNLVQA
jgi:hypothetical protein